jgi:dsRNA-specific ribonuclease
MANDFSDTGSRRHWLRLQLSHPSLDLLPLAERTTAALSQLTTDQSLRELNSNRQGLLRQLGDECLRVFLGKLLFKELRATNSDEVSLILNELDRRGFLVALSNTAIDESRLILAASESRDPLASAKRRVQAFTTLVGIYCYLGMSRQIETILVPEIAHELTKFLPLLRREMFERTDWKTALQEVSQSRSGERPSYQVIEEQGPDHNKTFLVRVTAPAIGTATGMGRSKKEAEQIAAQEALRPVIEKNPSLLRQHLRHSKKSVRANSSTSVKGSTTLKYDIPLEAQLTSLCGDPTLLRQALTHASASREVPDLPAFGGLATVGDGVVRVYLLRRIMSALLGV